MLATTHILLGDTIHRHILEKYRIRVNKTNLRYGSIKPDISRMRNNPPHYITHSLGFICIQIDKLINSINYKYELRDKYFSRKLGIILHYISDYFCTAHNRGPMYYSFISHMRYEKRLASYCTRYGLDTIRISVNSRLNNHDLDETNIKDYIIELNRLYQNEDSHYSYDLKYAIEACIMTTNYIVNRCIARIKTKAA